jgi:murein DD-endopeptidase MepM/ murein hydrolase activator NlpD
LTDGFKADFFNRMWVVGSIEHRYDGKLSTTLQLYTPLKPKPGITLGDSKLPQGQAVAVATGKILKPHSDGGVRGTPFDLAGLIRGRAHRGIDTSGDYNLRSGFDGVVSDINTSCPITPSDGCGDGFGNFVFIDGQGAWQGYTLVYAHLHSAAVSIGQSVKAGQVIGRMGNSGSSRGDHLHLELRKGAERLDPEPYISPCFTGTYDEGDGTPLKCKG